MVTKIDKTVDEDTWDQILEQVIVSSSVRPSDLEDIGERFGIYKAMQQIGPLNVWELAGCTGISEITTMAWLAGQLARDAVTYEVNTGRYSLWTHWPPLR